MYVTSNEKTSFVVVPIKSLCSAAAMRVSNFWQGSAKLSLDSISLADLQGDNFSKRIADGFEEKNL